MSEPQSVPAALNVEDLDCIRDRESTPKDGRHHQEPDKKSNVQVVPLKSPTASVSIGTQQSSGQQDVHTPNKQHLGGARQLSHDEQNIVYAELLAFMAEDLLVHKPADPLMHLLRTTLTFPFYFPSGGNHGGGGLMTPPPPMSLTLPPVFSSGGRTRSPMDSLSVTPETSPQVTPKATNKNSRETAPLLGIAGSSGLTSASSSSTGDGAVPTAPPSGVTSPAAGVEKNHSSEDKPPPPLNPFVDKLETSGNSTSGGSPRTSISGTSSSNVVGKLESSDKNMSGSQRLSKEGANNPHVNSITFNEHNIHPRTLPLDLLDLLGQADDMACCSFDLVPAFASRNTTQQHSATHRIMSFLNNPSINLLVIVGGSDGMDYGAKKRVMQQAQDLNLGLSTANMLHSPGAMSLEGSGDAGSMSAALPGSVCDCSGSGKTRLCKWLEFPGRYFHGRNLLSIDSCNVRELLDFLHSVDVEEAEFENKLELSMTGMPGEDEEALKRHKKNRERRQKILKRQHRDHGELGSMDTDDGSGDEVPVGGGQIISIADGSNGGSPVTPLESSPSIPKSLERNPTTQYASHRRARSDSVNSVSTADSNPLEINSPTEGNSPKQVSNKQRSRFEGLTSSSPTLTLIDNVEPPHVVLHALLQNNYFKNPEGVAAGTHKTILFTRPDVFYKFPIQCPIYQMVRRCHIPGRQNELLSPTVSAPKLPSFSAMVGPADKIPSTTTLFRKNTKEGGSMLAASTDGTEGSKAGKKSRRNRRISFAPEGETTDSVTASPAMSVSLPQAFGSGRAAGVLNRENDWGALSRLGCQLVIAELQDIYLKNVESLNQGILEIPSLTTVGSGSFASSSAGLSPNIANGGPMPFSAAIGGTMWSPPAPHHQASTSTLVFPSSVQNNNQRLSNSLQDQQNLSGSLGARPKNGGDSHSPTDDALSKVLIPLSLANSETFRKLKLARATCERSIAHYLVHEEVIPIFDLSEFPRILQEIVAIPRASIYMHKYFNKIRYDLSKGVVSRLLIGNFLCIIVTAQQSLATFNIPVTASDALQLYLNTFCNTLRKDRHDRAEDSVKSRPPLSPDSDGSNAFQRQQTLTAADAAAGSSRRSSDGGVMPSHPKPKREVSFLETDDSPPPLCKPCLSFSEREAPPTLASFLCETLTYLDLENIIIERCVQSVSSLPPLVAHMLLDTRGADLAPELMQLLCKGTTAAQLRRHSIVSSMHNANNASALSLSPSASVSETPLVPSLPGGSGASVPRSRARNRHGIGGGKAAYQQANPIVLTSDITEIGKAGYQDAGNDAAGKGKATSGIASGAHTIQCFSVNLTKYALRAVLMVERGKIFAQSSFGVAGEEHALNSGVVGDQPTTPRNDAIDIGEEPNSPHDPHAPKDGHSVLWTIEFDYADIEHAHLFVPDATSRDCPFGFYEVQEPGGGVEAPLDEFENVDDEDGIPPARHRVVELLSLLMKDGSVIVVCPQEVPLGTCVHVSAPPPDRRETEAEVFNTHKQMMRGFAPLIHTALVNDEEILTPLVSKVAGGSNNTFNSSTHQGGSTGDAPPALQRHSSNLSGGGNPAHRSGSALEVLSSGDGSMLNSSGQGSSDPLHPSSTAGNTMNKEALAQLQQPSPIAEGESGGSSGGGGGGSPSPKHLTAAGRRGSVTFNSLTGAPGSSQQQLGSNSQNMGGSCFSSLHDGDCSVEPSPFSKKSLGGNSSTTGRYSNVNVAVLSRSGSGVGFGGRRGSRRFSLTGANSTTTPNKICIDVEHETPQRPHALSPHEIAKREAELMEHCDNFIERFDHNTTSTDDPFLTCLSATYAAAVGQDTDLIIAIEHRFSAASQAEERTEKLRSRQESENFTPLVDHQPKEAPLTPDMPTFRENPAMASTPPRPTPHHSYQHHHQKSCCNNEKKKPIIFQADDNVSSICIIKDKYLVAGLENGSIQVFDIATGEERETFTFHESRVSVLRSMERTTTTSHNANKSSSKSSSRSESPQLRNSTSAPSIKFSYGPTADERESFFIAGSDDNTMSVYAIDDNSLVRTIRCHGAPIIDIAAGSAHSHQIIISLDRSGTIMVHTNNRSKMGDAGRVLWTTVMSNLKAINLCVDANWLLCTRAASLPLAVPISEWVRLGRGQFHSKAISTLHISRNDRYLLTGGADGVIFVWDIIDNMSYTTSFRQHPANSTITSISTSSDSTRVISADNQKFIYQWTLRTGEMIKIVDRAGGDFARFISNDYFLVRSPTKGLKLFDDHDRMVLSNPRLTTGVIDSFMVKQEDFEECFSHVKIHSNANTQNCSPNSSMSASGSTSTNVGGAVGITSPISSEVPQSGTFPHPPYDPIRNAMMNRVFVGISRDNEHNDTYGVEIYQLGKLGDEQPMFSLFSGEIEDEWGDEEDIEHSDSVKCFKFLQARKQYGPDSEEDPFYCPTLFLAATGADDLTCILWNWRKEEPLFVLQHSHFVNDIGFWFPPYFLSSIQRENESNRNSSGGAGSPTARAGDLLQEMSGMMPTDLQGDDMFENLAAKTAMSGCPMGSRYSHLHHNMDVCLGDSYAPSIEEKAFLNKYDRRQENTNGVLCSMVTSQFSDDQKHITLRVFEVRIKNAQRRRQIPRSTAKNFNYSWLECVEVCAVSAPGNRTTSVQCLAVRASDGLVCTGHDGSCEVVFWKWLPDFHKTLHSFTSSANFFDKVNSPIMHPQLMNSGRRRKSHADLLGGSTVRRNNTSQAVLGVGVERPRNNSVVSATGTGDFAFGVQMESFVVDGMMNAEGDPLEITVNDAETEYGSPSQDRGGSVGGVGFSPPQLRERGNDGVNEPASPTIESPPDSEDCESHVENQDLSSYTMTLRPLRRIVSRV